MQIRFNSFIVIVIVINKHHPCSRSTSYCFTQGYTRRRWTCRLPRCVKLLPHRSQRKGFSPVCVRRWRVTSSFERNFLRHSPMPQAKYLFCPSPWTSRIWFCNKEKFTKFVIFRINYCALDIVIQIWVVWIWLTFIVFADLRCFLQIVHSYNAFASMMFTLSLLVIIAMTSSDSRSSTFLVKVSIRACWSSIAWCHAAISAWCLSSISAMIPRVFKFAMLLSVRSWHEWGLAIYCSINSSCQANLSAYLLW